VCVCDCLSILFSYTPIHLYTYTPINLRGVLREAENTERKLGLEIRRLREDSAGLGGKLAVAVTAVGVYVCMCVLNPLLIYTNTLFKPTSSI
jgi:hypothetical protein